MLKNKINSVELPRSGATSICFRFVVTIFFSLLIASPIFGQTITYSDSYYVNGTGSTYDPVEDAIHVQEEPAGQNEMIGVGVTDTDYTDSSISVQTTLTAPNGTSTQATSYSDPWYSRAETAMLHNFDPDNPDATAGDYSVRTVHRYQEEYNPPCPSPPCNQTANYTRGAKAFPAQFYRIITRTTYFTYRFSVHQADYRLHSNTGTQCLYRLDCPEGATCNPFRTIYYNYRPGGGPCTAYLVSWAGRMTYGPFLVTCLRNFYARRVPYPLSCT